MDGRAIHRLGGQRQIICTIQASRGHYPNDINNILVIEQNMQNHMIKGKLAVFKTSLAFSGFFPFGQLSALACQHPGHTVEGHTALPLMFKLVSIDYASTGYTEYSRLSNKFGYARTLCRTSGSSLREFNVGIWTC